MSKTKTPKVAATRTKVKKVSNHYYDQSDRLRNIYYNEGLDALYQVGGALDLPVGQCRNCYALGPEDRKRVAKEYGGKIVGIPHPSLDGLTLCSLCLNLLTDVEA